jgi:hypothetical protein
MPKSLLSKISMLLVLAAGLGLAAAQEGAAIQLTPTVIDNFDNTDNYGGLTDQAGSKDAGWWVSSSQVYTNAIKITYNKPVGEEWSFVAAGALDQPDNQTDFTVADQLSLHLYGGVSLLIKFRDRNGNESSDSGILPAGNPNAWSTITWNFAAIDWHQCDRRHIKDVIIFVHPGQTGSGFCYLDDLCLGDAGPAPVNDTNLELDRFTDNTFWMTAGTRNAHWEPVDQSVYNFSISSEYGGAQPPYLKVGVSKAAGKEWAYFEAGHLLEPGNRGDFSQEHQLSMNLYGISEDVQLLIKFRDRYGCESGDSGTLTVNCNQQWKNLTWDYSQINWGQCDPRQVSAILFFVLPGNTGNLGFCLDNLMLGNGVAIPTPATTPVSNPYLMIDSFLDNDLEGDTGTDREAKWSFSPLGQVTGVLDTSVAGQNTLKITYNKPAGEEWANFSACYLNLKHNLTDFTIEHRLTLKVRGKVDFLFKFRDVNGNYSADSPVVSATNPTDWTMVTWDYSSVQWNQCDPHHVAAIVIFPEPGLTGKGNFDIRYITLGDGSYIPPAEGVIDNFDNDESILHTPGQQDAVWSCGPGTVYGCGVKGGNPTPDLLVNFANWGAQDFYFKAELPNALNLSNHSQLAFQTDMAGYTQNVTFVDVNGHESAIISLEPTTGSGYYYYDYSHLQWNQCDLLNIKEIRFHPYPGRSLAASVEIDDIRLTGPVLTVTP